MANDPENKFDSKPAIIPVRVGDETHHIEFPANTPVEEVHRALLDHVESAPEISDPNFKNKGVPYSEPEKSGPYGWKEAQPTTEGTLEHDPKFKDVASKVWQAAGYGKEAAESGTYLDQNLDRGPISSSERGVEGKMSVVVPKDAPYTIHSHPNHAGSSIMGGQPSATDIATAKKLGKYVYAVSRTGLQYAAPSGDTGVVFTDPTQFSGRK
jgi:hypothetical protein